MRPERLLAVFAVSWVGCVGSMAPPLNGGPDGGPSADAGSEVLDAGLKDAGYARSAKGNVRFKGDVRLTIDYALALELPFEQVCQELGQYPCSYGVHAVALGGVDPYGKGLYEALPTTGATTPLAVERVALAACVRRVELDLATPDSAVIFRSIPVSAGRLSEPGGSAVRLALLELAHRAWLRDPTEAELAHLVALSAAIAGAGVAEPAKAWMQAACFAAFSSTESVFY